MAKRKKEDADPKAEMEARVRKQAAAYHSCFTTPSGKIVLDDFMRSYHNRSCFDRDALVMAQKVTEKDMVQRILGLMDIARHPEKLKIEVFSDADQEV